MIRIILLLLLIGANMLFVAAQPGTASRDRIKVKPVARYLFVGGLRIRYLEWNPGGKKTVVLLHGLYDTAESWASLAPMLANDFRVIAPDRRGAGRTSRPLEGYDFGTLARDVSGLIDKLRLREVHVVGHSAGGGVALTLAAASVPGLASVSLVDGGFWERKDLSGAAPSCSEKSASCRRRLAIERGSADYDPQPLYPRVGVPALLILAVPPGAEAERFASELREVQTYAKDVADNKLKNGRLVLIRETGHWIQRDNPLELATQLKRFYAEIERTAGKMGETLRIRRR